MRELLRKRQEEQLDARAVEEKRLKEQERLKQREAEILEKPAAADEVASDEIPRLRKELNTIVSITSGRTGRPHGAIHTEARKNCGGPPTALCSAQQLRDRIAYLRQW